MRILISGACGFVGAAVARALVEHGGGHEIVGYDNFIRPGSEGNRGDLKRLGLRLVHADQRAPSDLEDLPAPDWVIDAAANPSVLAGLDGAGGSRRLVEHNLLGTVNILELCKRHRAGLILLSTSRVYALDPLARLPLTVEAGAFRVDPAATPLPPGVTAGGIDESFPTGAPVSLYGATKLASETLALEYGETFGFPVFVNRCGVMAGAGQFGRPDQGIVAFWLNSFLLRRPLRYISFGGHGHQVRDCLHPRDLLSLVLAQFAAPRRAPADRIINVGGGSASAFSLRHLSDWSAARFGPHSVGSDPAPRPFDIPWIVLNADRARALWGWQPSTSLASILNEVAVHAEANPDWLDRSAPL